MGRNDPEGMTIANGMTGLLCIPIVLLSYFYAVKYSNSLYVTMAFVLSQLILGLALYSLHKVIGTFSKSPQVYFNLIVFSIILPTSMAPSFLLIADNLIHVDSIAINSVIIDKRIISHSGKYGGWKEECLMLDAGGKIYKLSEIPSEVYEKAKVHQHVRINIRRGIFGFENILNYTRPR